MRFHIKNVVLNSWLRDARGLKISLTKADAMRYLKDWGQDVKEYKLYSVAEVSK